MPKIVNSWNEWDPLKRVIVGRPEGTNIHAFQNPSKPIGPFYSASQAEQLRQEKGWDVIEDSARGYRRVVPSPMSVHIQLARIIKSMLDAGEIVIAVGGRGILVVREDDRDLYGVEAVIDKDFASAEGAGEAEFG